TIQAAINAAHNGDRIAVYAGTYHESVLIPDSKHNISLFSVQPFSAKITTPTGSFADDTKSLVHVDGANHISITGFTIAGPGNGPADSLHFGVLVDDGGSADVVGNKILSIRDSTLSGTQEGVGIQFGQFSPN